VKTVLAARFKRQLALKGWSIRELARQLDQDATTISRICSGQSMPLTGLTVRVAQLFGVSVDELVGLAAEKKSSRAS
jgi:transcriptional regulator with XRE-family HTH domain